MARYRFVVVLLAVLLTGFVPGKAGSTGGTDCLTAYDLGNSPTALAVADFNGDGHPDLVAANSFGPHIAGHQVLVMLGTGGGRFGAPTAYEAGPGPASLAVGDFNGDDHEDLAVMNSFSSRPTSEADTVTVLLGTGTGTFGPPVAYGVGVDTAPVSVVAGDFDADGRLDLVVVNRAFTASVLLGVGDGSFGAVTTHALTGTSPPSVLSAVESDVNGDGHPDLVAANAALGNEAILIRPGNGAGGFDATVVQPTDATPYFVAPGDFNGDGNADLAVASSDHNTVSVLLGLGGGSFAAATTYRVRTAPASVAVGDFDADGHPDLAVANAGDDTVSVLLGTGDGGFAADSAYLVGRSPASVVAADFDADGRSDLAVANRVDSTVSVLLNVDTCVEATPRMCIGDCNSDGTVAIAELLTLVNIALGNASIAACPAASSWVPTADAYGLDVPELIKAVTDALYGCASCAPGTCRVSSEARCEEPTGPVGNACCQCRYDGWCAFVCICASPDTPIATPNGDVPIASLGVGDLVYSTSGSGIVAVPVLRTHRQAVHSHHVVQVRLATGAVLDISAGHPTADGRTFGELRVGDRLGDVPIVAVQVIPYRHDYTYDILPASDSGVYFAAGVPVGSTLHHR